MQTLRPRAFQGAFESHSGHQKAVQGHPYKFAHPQQPSALAGLACDGERSAKKYCERADRCRYWTREIQGHPMSKYASSNVAGNLTRVARMTMLCSALALSACTNGPSVKTLRTPAYADTITLDSVTAYQVKQGLFGNPWTYTLAAGTYTAEKEDSLGTYFRADGLAVTVREGDEKGLTWHDAGGIWMPRDGSKSPRVYYYSGTAPVTSGGKDVSFVGTQAGGAMGNAVMGAAISAEAGMINMAPEPVDPQFARTVRATFHLAPRNK